MRTWIIIALLGGLFWQHAICKSGQAHSGQWPSGMATGFDALLADYLKIKDALVAENTWGAAMAASRILTSLPNVDTRGLSGLQSHAWQLFAWRVRRETDEISGASGIAIQRQHFLPLSDCMVAAVEQVGAGPYDLHVQHCPMADAGRGGVWLSLHEQVQNPYFGEVMLQCGRNTRVVRGLQSAMPIPEGVLPGKMQGTFMHGCHGAGR